MIRGSNPDGGKRFSLLHIRPDRPSGSHSLLNTEYRDRFQGVKQPGRESDHSSEPSADVMNAYHHTCTLLLCFYVVLHGEMYFTFPNNTMQCGPI